jgi:hypothetical protein
MAFANHDMVTRLHVENKVKSAVVLESNEEVDLHTMPGAFRMGETYILLDKIRTARNLSRLCNAANPGSTVVLNNVS